MSDSVRIPYKMLIRECFSDAVANLSNQVPPPANIEEVLDLYDNPDRKYHNIDHIGTMLIVSKSARPRCTMPHEMVLAIIFHDAVYDPRGKNNEELSAELASRTLTALGVPGPSLALIENLILCTKHHIPTSLSDSPLIIDADLSILGSPDDVYEKYARAIRAEYSFVTDEDYRVGRTNVLRSFITRDSIYLLPWFRERFEDQARRNLELEIAMLGV